MRTLFLSFFIAAVSISATAKTPKTEHSIFYRITKPNSSDTSYLFGTLHLLEKSYVDTLPNLMAALARSKTVIGEIIVNSSIKDDLLGSTTMDTPLSKLISTKNYKMLSDEIESTVGVPLAFLDNFKPAVIYAMVLEMMYQKAHPENHTTGIPMDLYFQNVARSEGKELLGLETVKDQADVLFDSMPVKKQIAQLLDLVKHKKKAMRDMDDMLREYANADVDHILDDPDMRTYSKKELSELLYDRNKRWLSELPAILDRTDAFIAVGAGHLVGQYGLVYGLRTLGYNVAPASLR